VASAECEVVDTDDGHLTDGSVGYRPHCSQQSVPADGDSESAGKSGAGPACRRQADRFDHRRPRRCSPTPPLGQPRDLLGESPCPAVSSVAEEPAGLDIDQDRMPTDRGVGQLSAIPRMHTSGFTATPWAPRSVTSGTGLDPDRRPDSPHTDNIDTCQMREQDPHTVFSAPGESSPGLSDAGQ